MSYYLFDEKDNFAVDKLNREVKYHKKIIIDDEDVSNYIPLNRTPLSPAELIVEVYGNKVPVYHYTLKRGYTRKRTRL